MRDGSRFPSALLALCENSQTWFIGDDELEMSGLICWIPTRASRSCRRSALI